MMPSGRLSRRAVLRLTSRLAASGAAAAALAACGGAATPTAVPKAADTSKPAATKPAEAAKPAAAATKPAGEAKPAAAKEIPRNRTLIISGVGDGSKFKDHELWNPYAVGANHQTGSMLVAEPLAYYSAFADKMHMWLAESYKYSPDFKQLTLKTRSGITWSDGKSFSAEDVAYTFTTLKELGPKVKWGADVQQFVEEAKATDANTVEIKFKIPAPRFFNYASYKFDIGIYMIPKHIFEKEDWTTFKHFDVDKGHPVTTGPWKVTIGAPEQKVMELRGEWWAEKAGLAQMPKVERLVRLPGYTEQQFVTSLISNQIDYGMPIVNSYKAIIAQNPKITTFSGREKPFGYEDWWPLSLYVNNQKAPFDDKDVRWALSYFLDRKQIIEVSYEGANTASKLPMPTYPPLQPYFEVSKPLLEKWDTNAFDPARGAELLTAKGWKKDGSGIWTDAQGNKLTLNIIGFAFLSALGPVVAEQLKKQGVDAVYSMPPNAIDIFTKGEYEGCLFGHGGSVNDPYETLRLYQSSSVAIPGDHQSNFSRWKNAEYDKIVDQVYTTPMEDKAKLTQLFKQAMEIWLPELPDIQLVFLYHTIARNETYWKGWPTQDNPYVNEASWHLTFQLVLNKLEPVQ